MFVLVHPSLQLPDHSLDNQLKKNKMRSKIVNNTKNSLFFNKKTITRLSTLYQNKCIDYPKSTSSQLCFIECAKSRYKTMKKCLSYENLCTRMKIKYNIVLEYRNIPIILLKGGQKNKKHLPVEVCYVYPNQPMPKNLIKSSPTMTKAIIEETKCEPLMKLSLIQDSMEVIANESSEAMQMFGLTFNLKPIQLKGRVLKEPKLEGNQSKFKDGKELKEWCFFDFSRKRS